MVTRSEGVSGTTDLVLYLSRLGREEGIATRFHESIVSETKALEEYVSIRDKYSTLQVLNSEAYLAGIQSPPPLPKLEENLAEQVLQGV